MASRTTGPKPSKPINDTGAPAAGYPSRRQSPRRSWAGSGSPAGGVLQDPAHPGLESPVRVLGPLGPRLLEGVQPAEGEPVLPLRERHPSAPPAELTGDNGVLALPQHPLDPLRRTHHLLRTAQLRSGNLRRVADPLGRRPHGVERLVPIRLRRPPGR